MPDQERHSFSDLGIAPAAVHEFYAAQADSATAAGGALILAQLAKPGAQLWVRCPDHEREAGAPYAPGLTELGLDPARIILARAPDAVRALQAGLEAARCPALGAVLLELWGAAKPYDLVASRRLALAAKDSRVPVLIVRIAGEPRPSAAATRWLARAAPSRALATHAPGDPAFELTLLRARNGRDGLRYRLEWNRDVRGLIVQPVAAANDDACDLPMREDTGAPLSGAVVPVSFDRSGAPHDGACPWRRAG